MKKKTTSCVFDETFFFNPKNVHPDQVQTETIKVSVFDADTFSRNDLIGSFTYDVQTVYYQENHEVYRQWVALTDERNPADAGVQVRRVSLHLGALHARAPPPRTPPHVAHASHPRAVSRAGLPPVVAGGAWPGRQA